MKLTFFVALVFLVAFSSVQAVAVENDARFHIHLPQEEKRGLTVYEAMTLALPVLWQRVVPVQSLEKANTLKGSTSLVLQFKQSNRGVSLVFNPVQVQTYLQRNHIMMIPERPYWNLSIGVQRFVEPDMSMAEELMSFSHNISDKFGFQLGAHGRKLHLSFSQVLDVYGETNIQVEVQGAFSSDVLSEQVQPERGYLSYQLQSWVKSILLEIRDAYSLGTIQFNDDASSIYIAVTSDLTLASQVSLEQLLRKQPAVKSVIPILLQKASKQYRVILRDTDDSWVESWFASYGMTALKQPQGSIQWVIE